MSSKRCAGDSLDAQEMHYHYKKGGMEMRLVTGGAYQGKRQWVKTHWAVPEAGMADGAACSEAELYQAAAVDHFHLLVRRWMRDGEDAAERTEGLLRHRPEIIVITDEVGSGIVPMDQEERAYRELHGRICCRLAGEADQVVRVFCGIGQRLK